MRDDDADRHRHHHHDREPESKSDQGGDVILPPGTGANPLSNPPPGYGDQES